jgi:DNA-binding transcriptional LysR family regulator
VNSRQIEIFASVISTGSASRAADVMGITQSAVSRIRQRLVPTPEARLFHRAIEASFRGLDTLRAEAARIRDRGTGQLRVASLAALGSTLVPKAIRLLREQHPNAVVTLHVLPSRDVRSLVVSGEFDIGLAADEVDVTGLTAQPFVSPKAVCAIPASHALAGKKVIRPADLDGTPFITYVPEDRARQRMDLLFGDCGVAPTVVAETMYGSTLLALVAEGIGIGLVSPYAAANVNSSRVVLRPFEPAVPVKALLLLPPDRPKSRLVRDFIDALLKSR